MVRAALIVVALVAVSAPAQAQAQSAFPFAGFELSQLPEIYLYKTKSGGTPERSVKQAHFTRSLGGRIESGEVATSCANDDLPAALEKKPGRNAFLKMRYEPQPVTARFTCRGQHTWNVEYRTSVTVAGEVYTFDGQVRAVRVDDPTWVQTATEQAVITVSGASCKPKSFKRETVDEFFGHTRVSRVTTSDAGSGCKLYAR